MSDPFAFDDAAYVLGALSPAERAAFEAHLAGCDECRARVDEISAVPGMLAGITEQDLHVPAADASPPDTLLPSLLRTVRAQHRKRRVIATSVIGLAAAAIVALSVALVSSGGSDHTTPKPVALHALVASPVSATAVVQSKHWGTSITLNCHYASAYGPSEVYQLVVVDKAGQKHDGGTWQLTPGADTTFPGGTAVPRDQIASIEIAAGSTPILALTF